MSVIRMTRGVQGTLGFHEKGVFGAVAAAVGEPAGMNARPERARMATVSVKATALTLMCPVRPLP